MSGEGEREDRRRPEPALEAVDIRGLGRRSSIFSRFDLMSEFDGRLSVPAVEGRRFVRTGEAVFCWSFGDEFALLVPGDFPRFVVFSNQFRSEANWLRKGGWYLFLLLGARPLPF